MAAITRTRTTVVLSTLAVVLVVMVVLGFRAVTAKTGGSDETASDGPTCQKTKVTKAIFRRDVTVSVYNASSRSGFAERTMGVLEKKRFKVGAIGNAPAGSAVDYVQVRSRIADDPAAQLVAQQFNPVAEVVQSEDDLGPGVDVILGQKAKLPATKAPGRLVLDKPKTTCLDTSTVNPTTGTT